MHADKHSLLACL